jgi:CubicO group peptidase (beta-lactamase class C family)
MCLFIKQRSKRRMVLTLGWPRHALAAAILLASPAALRAQMLDAYTGTYEYRGGTTLELVPAVTRAGPRLVAVIDEAKYPLVPLGGDRFLNGVGDTVPFSRDAAGRVTGFRERGTAFARLTDTVTRATAASLVPRPPGAYTYRAPRDLGDGLAVGTLSGVLGRGMAERIVAGVVDGTYADVDGVLVYQGGRLVMEEYFHGYGVDRPHQMRSASKSFVSALVGAAIDRGALAGEGEKVLARLPYGPLSAYDNPDPRKAALTLGDLLTMRSGLACDDWDDGSPGNENRMYGSADWVKFTLGLPQLRDAGTEARYCTGGVHVAGRMVERATGKPLPVFAQEALFGPLGIAPRSYRWNYALDSSNERTVAQLYLRPRDFLKLGVVYLDGGRWRGRRVLSESWVARSTARATRIGSRGYGYYWWHQPFTVGGRRVEVLNASGNGGQKLYILPEHGVVVAFTGSAYNAPSETAPNAIMANVILPALLSPR